MSQPRHLHPADLQGLASLGIRGVTATTDLVEHMHHAITRVPGVHEVDDEPRTSGITGLVYRSIHGVAGLVGGTLDLALGVIAGRSDRHESTPERKRFLAILNGVLGDHLDATGNPLATAMTLRRDGVVVAEGSEAAALAGAGDRVAIFLHGLCLDDGCWRPAPDANHRGDLPAELAAAGWTVLHLRYNSGRHIHANGAEFGARMEGLVENWPTDLREIALIGHSMGGLIARSAIHQALAADQAWPLRVGRLVFLGAPHHGSPLERAGHGVDRILGSTRYTAPFTRPGKLRSAGITDLRHGNLLPGDAGHRDRFHPTGDTRRPARLPAQTECYAVAATLDNSAESARSRYLGDGLVPVPSALGRHEDIRLDLSIDADRTHVTVETGHIEMLHRPEIVRRVRTWLDS